MDASESTQVRGPLGAGMRSATTATRAASSAARCKAQSIAPTGGVLVSRIGRGPIHRSIARFRAQSIHRAVQGPMHRSEANPTARAGPSEGAAPQTPKQTCSQSVSQGTDPAALSATHQAADNSMRGAVWAPETPPVTARTTAQAVHTRRGSMGSTALPSV